jgi:hypothetical protein
VERQAGGLGRVFAMALGAFVLVASEFMPVSLLTPIATDLHISEGQAGQAIGSPARSRCSPACSSRRWPDGSTARCCCWR